jgi:CRP/FNR family transcriptional regulator, cyclic AMP receptor protein
MTLLTTNQKRDFLQRVALFQDVDNDGLDAIASQSRELEFSAGHLIIREGEMGTGFFLVVRGRAHVVHGSKCLALCGPGDYFGELSLLGHVPRVASVVAQEPTTCLALASWELDAVLERYPRVAVSLLREALRRMRALLTDVRGRPSQTPGCTSSEAAPGGPR